MELFLLLYLLCVKYSARAVRYEDEENTFPTFQDL